MTPTGASNPSSHVSAKGQEMRWFDDMIVDRHNRVAHFRG